MTSIVNKNKKKYQKYKKKYLELKNKIGGKSFQIKIFKAKGITYSKSLDINENNINVDDLKEAIASQILNLNEEAIIKGVYKKFISLSMAHFYNDKFLNVPLNDKLLREQYSRCQNNSKCHIVFTEPRNFKIYINISNKEEEFEVNFFSSILSLVIQIANRLKTKVISFNYALINKNKKISLSESKYIFETGIVKNGKYNIFIDKIKSGFSNNNFLNNPDGRMYKGETVGNIPHGRGELYFNGKIIKEGIFKKGILVKGESRHIKNNNLIKVGYDGEYENGKKNGFGIFTYQSGIKYIGNWKDGNKHGIGKIINNNDEIFSEGIFDQNNIIRGKLYLYNIKEYEGELGRFHKLKSDYHNFVPLFLPHGKGVIYDIITRKKKYEGTFIENKKSGYGVEYKDTLFVYNFYNYIYNKEYNNINEIIKKKNEKEMDMLLNKFESLFEKILESLNKIYLFIRNLEHGLSFLAKSITISFLTTMELFNFEGTWNLPFYKYINLDDNELLDSNNLKKLLIGSKKILSKFNIKLIDYDYTIIENYLDELIELELKIEVILSLLQKSKDDKKLGNYSIIKKSFFNENIHYQGFFKDNLYHGKGKLYDMPNNYNYDGYFEDGYKHGIGTLYFVTGDKKEKLFEGTFKKNYFDRGTAYSPNGFKYVGQFSKKNLRNGDGIEYDKNGNILYSGSWKDDLREGNGKLYDLNGNVIYEGFWKNNFKDGIGTDFYSNRKKLYYGEFKNNEMNGYGEYYDKNGNILYKGYWKDGLYHGDGKTFSTTEFESRLGRKIQKIDKQGKFFKGDFIAERDVKRVDIGRLMFKHFFESKLLDPKKLDFDNVE